MRLWRSGAGKARARVRPDVTTPGFQNVASALHVQQCPPIEIRFGPKPSARQLFVGTPAFCKVLSTGLVVSGSAFPESRLSMSSRVIIGALAMMHTIFLWVPEILTSFFQKF
jgi:hypothetical protein